jgi:hypothetical protein
VQPSQYSSKVSGHMKHGTKKALLLSLEARAIISGYVQIVRTERKTYRYRTESSLNVPVDGAFANLFQRLIRSRKTS